MNAERTRRCGELSVQLTACNILTFAINVFQNGWSFEELSMLDANCGPSAAGMYWDLRAMWTEETLREIYLIARRACWQGNWAPEDHGQPVES
jgi:hypothetical protein